MIQPSPEAVTLRCERCGGGFPFAEHPQGVRCPYCGQVQTPSPALMAALERYRANVQGEIAQANEAYTRAATWEGWANYGRNATPKLKVMIPLMSGVTLLAALAFPASQALGISPAVMQTFMTPVLVVAPMALMVYVVAQSLRRGATASRVVAGRIAVACPSCGAPGELVAGAPAQVCSYCRSTLVASAPVMQRGTDAAVLAHRRARLEEVRQERAGMATFASYDMSGYVLYFSLGPIVLMLGGSSIAFTVQMLDGSEPYSPAIFVLWAMFLGSFGFGLFWILWRRARRAAFRTALADLGHQFPLARLEKFPDVVEWLNRHWPERYEGTTTYPSPELVAAALDVFGYPALLLCDLDSGANRVPRLHLLVAAVRTTLPAAPLASGASRTALARCRELGFDVSFTDAGLLGRANEATRALVRRSPAALHAVAPVVTSMARAAYELGAVPARDGV